MNESRDRRGVAWLIWWKVGTEVLIDGWRNVFVAWNEVFS
jgi:hypothetical protein